jgi:pimeloyl-ACP methyl ester carboxylesterase
MANHIFFLHGKGGSSSGTIKLLRDTLLPCFTDAPQITLLDFPSGTAGEYYAGLLAAADKFPPGSMLVGVSLGGLVAAKLLQDHRPDLTVVALASPTYADGLALTKRNTPNLYALYSHNDQVVGDRINWEDFTHDHADVDWMADHRIDLQRYNVALVLSDLIVHGDFRDAVRLVETEVADE